MSDLRDTRSGAYDAVSPEGNRQPHQVREAVTPHEAAQGGADVRPEPLPGPAENPELPEGLTRPRRGPLNAAHGRGGANQDKDGPA
jgi:hypothetical protein